MAHQDSIYNEDFSLMADEVGVTDTKVMGVFGAIRRGATKEEALKKYGLTEKEYDDNIDRVLNGYKRLTKTANPPIKRFRGFLCDRDKSIPVETSGSIYDSPTAVPQLPKENPDIAAEVAFKV